MSNSKNLAADTAPLEYPYDGSKITACADCLPWSVEFYDANGQSAVREWHAVGCDVFSDDA